MEQCSQHFIDGSYKNQKYREGDPASKVLTKIPKNLPVTTYQAILKLQHVNHA